MTRRLTGQQRRALFAAARAIGLDLDDVRAMTPSGSVSQLTWLQADSLLRRLKGSRIAGHTIARREHAASPGQPSLIRELAKAVGFGPGGFERWALRFGVEAIDLIDRETAGRLIASLRAVQSLRDPRRSMQR